jgi:hypothetical protein
MEKKEQSGNDASNSLKNQFIQILENLLSACNDPAWLKRQIKYIKNKKLKEESYYMSNVATAFWCLLKDKQSELVNAENPYTKELRDFLKLCQANFEIIEDPNETIEQTASRIFNEMKAEAQAKHLRKF